MKRSAIVGIVAVLGFLTAAMAFGEQLVGFFRTTQTSPAEHEPAMEKTPTHVVIHQSGTNAPLSEPDDLIISTEMQQRLPGHGVDAANPAMTETGPWTNCAGARFRIFNSTSQTITVEYGPYESDYRAYIAIGPSERFVTEALDSNLWLFRDTEDRWAYPYLVEECERAGESSSPR